jgi:hypothetical protein
MKPALYPCLICRLFLLEKYYGQRVELFSFPEDCFDEEEYRVSE